MERERNISQLNNNYSTLEDGMKRWELAVRKRKWNMTGLTWDHNDNSLSNISSKTNKKSQSHRKKSEHT